MFVARVGKKACGYALDLAQSVAPKKVYRFFEKSPSSANMTETFVKEAQGAVPKKLQSVLEQCGQYEPEKKKFFTELYKAGDKKFDFIVNHENFGTSMLYFNDKEFVRAVKQMDEKELKTTFDEITQFYEKLPQVSYQCDEAGNLIYQAQKPVAVNLAQLTILKANNRQAYDYILNHPDKELVSSLLETFESKLNGSALKTLTVPQIRQITGEAVTCSLDFKTDRELISKGYGVLREYVESSDILAKYPQKIETLSKYLSKTKINEPFTAFRAERDTGMFSSVVLDKNLARQTKWFILKNMFKAKKIQVHDYVGNYDTYFAKKQNLFGYIMGKQELTLADAMQVAKYGNESYKKQIIELIKKSQIKDSRFKSLTFDSAMARSWLPVQGSNNTGVLHNVTVKEGLQGTYSTVDNRQAEFILNNNEKTITFQDVVYDPQADIFRVNSTISS